MSKNCVYKKYYGTELERTCNHPYSLNPMYIKDVTERFTGEVELCLEDANKFLDSFMEVENKIEAEIRK